jgi:hypothetical protein
MARKPFKKKTCVSVCVNYISSRMEGHTAENYM